MFSYCQHTSALDGFTRLVVWIFDYSFWLFNYSFWLFYCCCESKRATARYTHRMLNFLGQKCCSEPVELHYIHATQWWGNWWNCSTEVSRSIYGTVHAQNRRIFSNDWNGLRFALFCNFNDIWQELWINICWNDLSGIQRANSNGIVILPPRNSRSRRWLWNHFDIMDLNHHDTYG